MARRDGAGRSGETAGTRSRTPILIVGAGPVGLALACDLGVRGIDCTLIEKRDGSISLPKMSAVSARNMEFCRRWGIAETVRTAVWPESHTMDFVYVDTLRGRELARVKLPTLAQWGKLDYTPEGGCHCPQIYFDPILAARVRTLGSVRLRYNTRLDAFEQDADGVRAAVTDLATNTSETIAARYLVGCDGPGGVVREALGIGIGGLGVVANSVNIFFRSSTLAGFHDKGWARFYRLLDETGCWAELIPIDGRKLWRLTVFDDASAAAAPQAALARMAGGTFAHEILSVMPWERRDVVAERYGDGRVLIAGDAAHQCSPTGGLGMHTGIEEAVNLAWKLAAMVEGWGGEGLIRSYDDERRPIAVRNVALATATFNAIRSTPSDGCAAASGDWRQELGRMSPGEKQKMDYAYDGSPICIGDDGASAARAARPGARAPHAWLADGRSTLDLFGKGFTLLRFGADAPDPAALIAAAGRRGVPLGVTTIEDHAIAALYGRRLVLVRPDGHVAWRGDAWTVKADDIIDRVRGAAVYAPQRLAAVEANG
jgi:2-polyprenyl-6-methoxyphenol hydroxylase-like FAD-dependent oxidoreductase